MTDDQEMEREKIVTFLKSEAARIGASISSAANEPSATLVASQAAAIQTMALAIEAERHWS